MQCGEGVEIDFGALISKISPRAIITRVKVCCRRKLPIAILSGLPRRFVQRWGRLKPGDAKFAFLFRTVIAVFGTQVRSHENGAVTP